MVITSHPIQRVNSYLIIVLLFFIGLMNSGCEPVLPEYMQKDYEKHPMKSVAVLPLKNFPKFSFKFSERLKARDYSVVAAGTVQIVLNDMGINIESITEKDYPRICKLLHVDGLMVNTLSLDTNYFVESKLFDSSNTTIWINKMKKPESSEFKQEYTLYMAMSVVQAPLNLPKGVPGGYISYNTPHFSTAAPIVRDETEMLKELFEALPKADGKGVFLSKDYKQKHNFTIAEPNELVVQSESDSAIAMYTRTIMSDTSQANDYYSRGIEYKKLRKYDEALSDFQHAHELNPANWVYIQGISDVLFEQKKYVEALTGYSQVTKIEPFKPAFEIAYYKSGKTLYRIGEYARALESYNKITEKDFKTSEYYCDMGFCYFELKQYSEALAAFTKAQEFEEINHLAYFGSTLCYYELGDTAHVFDFFGFSKVAQPLLGKGVEGIKQLEDTRSFFTPRQKTILASLIKDYTKQI